MPDYQKGKIYKLYSVSNEELVYYGSTIETLSARLSKHVYDYNHFNGVESSLVIGAGDYKIELVENYPCVNKQQLVKKESEYIRNNICVNKVIPDRTIKEWREDNKEKIAEQMKQYYQNNKEALLEQRKEYYENNKEAIAEQRKEYYENNKEATSKYNKQYYKNNKEKIKEYRENNKETIAENKKQYRENNKEKIKEYYENNKETIAERKKEKITCECGCIIRKNDLAKHKKTKKHLKLIQ